MRWISSLALLAASTACQPQPDSTHLATAPGQLQPECRDFRAPLTAVRGAPGLTHGVDYCMHSLFVEHIFAGEYTN